MESCELGRYWGTTKCETSSEAGGEGYVTGLCVLHTFQKACNKNFLISLHGQAEKKKIKQHRNIALTYTNSNTIYTTKCARRCNSLRSTRKG